MRGRMLAPLVAAVAMVLVMRALFVIGFATPLVVEGSSMAPTLRGARLELPCSACDGVATYGLDQLPTTAEVTCPRCHQNHLRLEEGAVRPGERLIVNRTATPQRWDIAVMQRPDDARRLCVKRVLGLPGERVRLAAGDLFVDGQPIHKDFATQRRLRVLLHEEANHRRRWRAEQPGWQPTPTGWAATPAGDTRATLRYQPPGGGLITDDLPYNGRVARRLNPVRDLMLGAKVKLATGAHCRATIVCDEQRVAVEFERTRAGVQCRLMLPTGDLHKVESSAKGRFAFALSTFDQQTLIAINNETIFRKELPRPVSATLRRQEIQIAASSGHVQIDQLRLWRDIYYEPASSHRPPAYQLAADEWFVVGDNQAVSHDSRSWRPTAGVPSRLMVGVVPLE